MREVLEPFYNFLFTEIDRIRGSDVIAFDKGLRYTNATQGSDGSLFPYIYLGVPTCSEVVPADNPAGYRYTISVPLVCLTYGTPHGVLFGADDSVRGAFEILYDISLTLWDQYVFGFPLTGSPDSVPDWTLESWTLGVLEGIDHKDQSREIDMSGFLSNANVEIAHTAFVGTFHEYSTFPGVG